MNRSHIRKLGTRVTSSVPSPPYDSQTVPLILRSLLVRFLHASHLEGLMLDMKRILSRFIRALRLAKSPRPKSTQDPPPKGALPALGTGSSVSAHVPDGSICELFGDTPQFNGPLETLPVELQRQLLAVLELEELSALVHASPIFHHEYLLNRRSILCACLETTLRGVTVDACTVYRSSFTHCSHAYNAQQLTAFLTSYQDRRSSTQYSVLSEKFAEQDALSMVTFYFSTIKPLALRYTAWALDNLADATNHSQPRDPLSRTEKHGCCARCTVSSYYANSSAGTDATSSTEMCRAPVRRNF